MNEKHQFIIEKLSQFLKEFSEMPTEPEQETVELCIKEIYSEVNSLNEESDPCLSQQTILEHLYNLADIVCEFAELFEEKFPNALNALNFRNMELKIAKQYKASGGNDFWRDIWEIYIDISGHYSALNIDSKSLSNAKTALKLIQKKQNADPRDISYIYRRIAFAYQDIAPDKSIVFFNKSTETITEYNNKTETYENYLDIATNKINIAILMYEINQIENSIEVLNDVIDDFSKIIEKYDENETIIYYYASIYSVLAKAHFELQEYENCLNDVNSGLFYYNKISETQSQEVCEVADTLYSTASLALRNQENYMEAIELQYKILSIWQTQEESFMRSCRISDVYVDISIIFSKYLYEQGMAVETARLSMKEIQPYISSNMFISSKKALSARRRCFMNLADVYYRAEMLQSALTTYRATIDIIKKELEIEPERISLVYSYAYSLYQLANLNFKFGSISDGCKYLSCAYKSISVLKKYGGNYEILFNSIYNALITHEKRFDGKIIELDKAQ